jgi:hypothetical protein
MASKCKENTVKALVFVGLAFLLAPRRELCYETSEMSSRRGSSRDKASGGANFEQVIWSAYFFQQML